MVHIDVLVTVAVVLLTLWVVGGNDISELDCDGIDENWRYLQVKNIRVG